MSFNNLFSAVNLLDLSIQEWINTWRFSELTGFFEIFTHVGSMMVLIAVSLLVFLWLGAKKMWPEAVVSYTCLISAYLVSDVLKDIVSRSRPAGEVFTIAYGYSFPSGHALLSMAYYGFLAVLLLRGTQGWLRNLLGAGFIIAILMIGFSRIYLNVHYFSDVIAGFVLGLLVLWINWLVLRRFQSRQSIRDD